MDYIQEIKNISQKNGGIIDTRSAEMNGISRSMLSKLCKNNSIQRIAYGQYILPNEIGDELLSISMRSQNIVFSHETALFLHGISDRTPFEHTITVPADKRPPTTVKGMCKVYYIKPDLFDLGVTLLKTPSGNAVKGYDLERTICDCVRSRNRIGSETFLFALKQYSKRPDKNLNKLNLYANSMGVSNVLHNYLEVLL